MAASYNELGATLRSWRDRLAPEELGLPVVAHRRVRGLRRQEVAQLAGVSMDYVVQLEQGRASAPSPQVLNALARVLRLTEVERGHLFQLAGQADETTIVDVLPGRVRRLVDQLSASPAAVYDARWNPVARNAMWIAVMGDPLDRPERERNLVWRAFTGLDTRVRRSAAEQLDYEEAIVADLRSCLGRYRGDQRLAQLIVELRAASPAFRRLWDARRVGSYEQEHKTIDHPALGLLQLDCVILTTHRSDLRVAVYTAAPDSDSAHRLEALRAPGSRHPSTLANISSWRSADTDQISAR
jgi:transcriptional regulator with XRE-family HTH domain